MSRLNTSSEVGSIQCASSNSASTGASLASPANSAISAAIVRSFCFARRHFERGIAPLERDRQQRGEKGRIFLGLETRTRDHRLQLVEPRRRRLAGHEARRVPDLGRDGIESVVDVMRRALVAHRDMRLTADPLAQRRKNARLADAGFAREQRDLAFALARVAPAVDEQRHLMLAPDERRRHSRTRRLEAADVLGLAQNRPGGNRARRNP